MAITFITRDQGINVSIVRLTSTDNLATVAGSTYLTAQAANITAANNGTWTWLSNDMVLVSASDGLDFFTLAPDFSHLILFSTAGNGAVTLPVVSGNFTVFNGTLGALKDAGFSPSNAAKTKVVMANGASIVNHIATYTDTAGTIGEDAATAINGGNIQAGLSGTAGTLASFPSGATSGSLILAAVTNSSGNFNTTISNASAVAQSQVISIPDSGSATANFILSKSAGTQHITSGNLEVDAGNITAGISGTAGTFVSFPGTAANGTLILAAANAGGAFNTTISNGAMGQSTVYTMGDIGASTGGLVVATSAIRMKSVAQAAVAGGAAAQTVTDTFCTAGSMVTCTWNDTTNPVTIQKAVAGNGSFVVTSSGDPGASHLNYIITK